MAFMRYYFGWRCSESFNEVFHCLYVVDKLRELCILPEVKRRRTIKKLMVNYAVLIELAN